jgi:hypothetical protein
MAKNNRIVLMVTTLGLLVLAVILYYANRPSPGPELVAVVSLVNQLRAEQAQGDAQAQAAIHDGKYLAIVHEIEAGRIAADAEGTAVLPPAFGGLIAEDRLIVERKADGRLLVIFPTWRGKGGNFDGYLYASQPLVPADFQEINWGAGGVCKQATVAGFDYIDVHPLQSPWYQVSRSVD